MCALKKSILHTHAHPELHALLLELQIAWRTCCAHSMRAMIPKMQSCTKRFSIARTHARTHTRCERAVRPCGIFQTCTRCVSPSKRAQGVDRSSRWQRRYGLIRPFVWCAFPNESAVRSIGIRANNWPIRSCLYLAVCYTSTRAHLRSCRSVSVCRFDSINWHR